MAKHRFRILFGVSVEVAEGRPTETKVGKVAPPPKGWRKDFADPLYIKPLDEQAADGAAFEMVIAKMPEVFNGDGCDVDVKDPMRNPPRKSAVIAVRCTPCVPLESIETNPNAAPEYDKICSLTKEDACTLRATLALRCPPREIVYAPGGEGYKRARLSFYGHAGCE